MILTEAIKKAIEAIYFYNSDDGELESVYIADFANDRLAGSGVRESVRGYLWDSEGGLYLDLSQGLDSLKNQVFVSFFENEKVVSVGSLKAFHYFSDKWRVFACVHKVSEV